MLTPNMKLAVPAEICSVPGTSGVLFQAFPSMCLIIKKVTFHNFLPAHLKFESVKPCRELFRVSYFSAGCIENSRCFSGSFFRSSPHFSRRGWARPARTFQPDKYSARIFCVWQGLAAAESERKCLSNADNPALQFLVLRQPRASLPQRMRH